MDPDRYSLLVYGVPKIGKTTLLNQWPDVFFIATEPGLKAKKWFGEEVQSWTDVRVLVKTLAKSKRFKTIVIDTAEIAYELCMEYVCQKRGVEDPTDADDYGATWRAVRDEFKRTCNALARTGRGVNFTSHARVETINTGGRRETQRIVPALTGQASNVILGLVDFFFYLDYFRDRESGEVVRVMVCEGDEGVLAGFRGSQENKVARFPRFLPLEEDGGYEVYRKGFLGKHSGIDPDKLKASVQTSSVAADFLGRARLRKEEKGRVAPKRKK
jgi:hypothetical protein